MTEAVAGIEYEAKPTGYFTWPRLEMLPFIPASCRRLLDVGCAEGTFGDSLKKTRGIEVWGVEPTGFAAASARAKLDHVIEGLFGPGIVLPSESFDCIVFNDVLEHMVAPDLALRYARSLLAPGGVVVASIPNIRSFPTLWRLMYHRDWEYQDSGVLDKTHLRFFTKSSIAVMFEREGFDIETISGINAYAGTPNVRRRVWLLYELANAVSLGKVDDMRFQQFAVVARPAA